MSQARADVPGGETTRPEVPSGQEHSSFSAAGTQNVGCWAWRGGHGEAWFRGLENSCHSVSAPALEGCSLWSGLPSRTHCASPQPQEGPHPHFTDRETESKEVGCCARGHTESARTKNQAQGLTADP